MKRRIFNEGSYDINVETDTHAYEFSGDINTGILKLELWYIYSTTSDFYGGGSLRGGWLEDDAWDSQTYTFDLNSDEGEDLLRTLGIEYIADPENETFFHVPEGYNPNEEKVKGILKYVKGYDKYSDREVCDIYMTMFVKLILKCFNEEWPDEDICCYGTNKF